MNIRQSVFQLRGLGADAAGTGRRDASFALPSPYMGPGRGN
jgi:hypothetical protein